LCFYYITNSQEVQKKNTVYFNSKKIGFLYEQTEIPECEECYVLDTIKIFNKFFTIKNEVILLGLDTENGTKYHFFNLYDYKLRKKNKYFIIELNNRMDSSAGEIYIKKANNNIILYNIFKHNNSSIKIEIVKNDFNRFPSTLICIQNTNINMHKRILDFNLLPKVQEEIDCFNCPTKYPIDECLKMRKNKQKMKWN
jgi:hypothetical protein